jgi:hypothetical protein
MLHCYADLLKEGLDLDHRETLISPLEDKHWRKRHHYSIDVPSKRFYKKKKGRKRNGKGKQISLPVNEMGTQPTPILIKTTYSNKIPFKRTRILYICIHLQLYIMVFGEQQEKNKEIIIKLLTVHLYMSRSSLWARTDANSIATLYTNEMNK